MLWLRFCLTLHTTACYTYKTVSEMNCNSCYNMWCCHFCRCPWAAAVRGLSTDRLQLQCVLPASCQRVSRLWWGFILIQFQSFKSEWLSSSSNILSAFLSPGLSISVCLSVVMEVIDSRQVACKLYKGLSDALICTDEFITKVVQR